VPEEVPEEVRDMCPKPPCLFSSIPPPHVQSYTEDLNTGASIYAPTPGMMSNALKQTVYHTVTVLSPSEERLVRVG